MLTFLYNYYWVVLLSCNHFESILFLHLLTLLANLFFSVFSFYSVTLFVVLAFKSMILILTLIYDQSSLFMGSVSLSYSFLYNNSSINEMKLVDQPG